MNLFPFLKKFLFVAALGFLLLGVSLRWFPAMPEESNCSIEHSTNTVRYKAHPVKVVVKPWLGQHQVFGVFIIPLRYRSGATYFVTISVPGFRDEFPPDWQPQEQKIEDIYVDDGHYLIKGYIPTRIALRLFFTGHLRDLQIPCNWTLEFVKREPPLTRLHCDIRLMNIEATLLAPLCFQE